MALSMKNYKGYDKKPYCSAYVKFCSFVHSQIQHVIIGCLLGYMPSDRWIGRFMSPWMNVQNFVINKVCGKSETVSSVFFNNFSEDL